jgi:hypothetical protein
MTGNEAVEQAKQLSWMREIAHFPTDILRFLPIRGRVQWLQNCPVNGGGGYV